jgi:hypothetical protein
MKKASLLFVAIISLFFSVFLSSSFAAVVEWSQLPLMAKDGYDFSSETQIPSTVADDFLSTGASITGLTWWGSYWDATRSGGGRASYPAAHSHIWGDPVPNPPGTVTGFVISFWSDVPAKSGKPPWSHPGTLLYAEMIPLDGMQVKEAVYGTIERESGVTETVFRYDAVLPVTFLPDAGHIYWLSVQAIDPEGKPVQWGWHESIDHWNDNAVQQGFMPPGKPKGWHLLAERDMAFEVQAVPIPGSVLLLGAGLIGILGLRRKLR